MAVSILISDVLEQASFRLHLPDFASGEFVTDTQALALAKMSVSRLGAMLNRCFGDDYFARTDMLATQAGLDVVSLPEDCKDLISLHWIEGNCQHLLSRMPVTRYEPVAKAWGNTYMPQYRLEGNTIRFAPPPSAVYTLRITYSTGLAISSLTDSVLALPGCDEWLVLDVCELIREREDKDASNFSARKMQIEADLKSQAMQRDRHGVTTVRDVRGEICDDDDRLFWRNRWGQ